MVSRSEDINRFGLRYEIVQLNSRRRIVSHAQTLSPVFVVSA